MTGKQRAAAGFAAFLIFMAVCTLIAKGLYASGLPKITVTSPERKNITHEVEAKGAVRQGQEFGVYTETGLRVATVLKRNGDSFAQGDPLFQIDQEDLNDIIAQKELELAKLESQHKGAAGTSDLEQRRQNVTLARAREDYNTAVRDADLLIARTRLTLTKAQEALDEYKKYLDGLPLSQISAGDSGGELERNEKWKQLEQAVLEAAQAVEDALLAKDDKLKEAGRTIEDAQLADESLSSPDRESTRLEADYRRAQLAELKRLAGDEGWIYAREAGRVTAQKLAVGERTADSACLLYALDDGNRIVEVTLTEEQARYVSLGDTAKLTFRDKTGAASKQEAVIDYLETGEDGSTLAQMRLEEANVEIGQMVDIKLSKPSEAYENCIPRNALYSDGQGGYFVYLAEEQEGILGKEWRVRKLSVTVLDQNNSFAAVENAGISQETMIVDTYDKEFSEGDVVRLAEGI